MDWVTERIGYAWEAIRRQRFIVFGLSAIVVRGLIWVSEKLAGRGVTTLTSVPEWLIWILVILFFVTYCLIEHGVKLRRQLTPKLSVVFAPEGGCIVVTPIKETIEVMNIDSTMKEKKTEERRQVEIRALVTAGSQMEVKDCVPYLTSVRKKDQATGVLLQTNYVDDLQLPWHMDKRGPIAIPKDVRRYFTIVHIDEKVMQPRIATGWPLTLRNLFNDKTTYELGLLVKGDGISVPLKIEFTWDGNLDNVKGRQLQN